SAQNTQNGTVLVDGRYDVTANSGFVASAQAAHLNIPRTSSNSPGNAAEPVTYNDYRATAGYNQTALKVGYEVDFAVESTMYNATTAVGGGPLPQSSQNLLVSEGVTRLSYELVPDYLGYLRFAADWYAYPHIVPGGMRFNSSIYRTDIGLQIQ